MWYGDVTKQNHHTKKEDAMSNVTEFGKKANNQVHELMENVSWVVGIDIGKEKLSCALMDIKKPWKKMISLG